MSGKEVEKRESLSSFEKLTEQFRKMSSEREIHTSIRSTRLKKDGTHISMTGLRDFKDDSQGCPILNEYRVEIEPPVLPGEKNQSLGFTVREDNVLKSINMPFATCIINDIKVPLIFKDHDKERYVSQQDTDASISAAKALTDWFCNVINDGKYTKPQVSISN